MTMRTSRRRPGLAKPAVLLGWLALAVFAGAGSYWTVSKFLTGPGSRPATEAEVVAELRPATKPAEPEEDAEAAAQAKARAEAAAQKALERKEAERKKAEDERIAQEQEKERQEQLALAEKRKQEESAKLEMERLAALKRNPKATASLEDIERSTEKYMGQYLTVDRVILKVGAVDMHKDLARFTLGVTSEQGKYFSRVPINGLIVSASEKLGKEIQKEITASDDYYRFKLYAEVRQWQKKPGAGTPYPEVYLYRLEAYSRGGKLTKTLAE